MANITLPWQDTNTLPVHNQRILACIGERQPGSKRDYIIARYHDWPGNRYLSYPLYTGLANRQEEVIPISFLIAWQPLEIEGPE